jgi:hypothetical protein
MLKFPKVYLLISILNGIDYQTFHNFSIFAFNISVWLSPRPLVIANELVPPLLQSSLTFVFQREDWRLRPLTMEMINYARTDAHYLLYIANCMVSELQTKACGMAFLTFDFQQHVFLLACLVQSRVL